MGTAENLIGVAIGGAVAVGVTQAAFGRKSAAKRAAKDKKTERRKPVAKKKKGSRKGSRKSKQSSVKTPIDRIPVGKVKTWL